MIAHKISPETAQAWGITVKSADVDVDFTEIDPATGEVTLPDGTVLALDTLVVAGLERYLHIIGF